MDETLKSGIESAKDRIRISAIRAGRNPEDIRILAATKKVPPGRIIEAVKAGINLIGENIVQESEEKFMGILSADKRFFSKHSVERHFIGHLQRNKVRRVLALFDVIESVDSFRLAERISRDAENMKKKARIFLEVNVGGEASKYGFAPGILREEAEKISQLKNIVIEGLMCVPPANAQIEELRKHFSLMRYLRKELRFIREELELSMGMSNDFEIAVEEGATIVRLGRILFGNRN